MRRSIGGSSTPLGNSGQDISAPSDALMGLLIPAAAARFITGSSVLYARKSDDAFGCTVSSFVAYCTEQIHLLHNNTTFSPLCQNLFVYAGLYAYFSFLYISSARLPIYLYVCPSVGSVLSALFSDDVNLNPSWSVRNWFHSQTKHLLSMFIFRLFPAF